MRREATVKELGQQLFQTKRETRYQGDRHANLYSQQLSSIVGTLAGWRVVHRRRETKQTGHRHEASTMIRRN